MRLPRITTAALTAAALTLTPLAAAPIAGATPPAPVAPGSNAANAKVSEGFLTSTDGQGTQIYWKSQTIPGAKGNVVVVHGASEHQGRFDRISNQLLDAGYNVYRMDHRGHGKTGRKEGTPVPLNHIDDFRYLVDDVHSVVEKAKAENPGLKTFMIGHSMGALAAQYHGIVYPGSVDGIVTNGGGAPLNLSGRKDGGEVLTPQDMTEAQRNLAPTSSEALPLTQLTSFNDHMIHNLIPGRTDVHVPSFPGSDLIQLPNPFDNGVASDQAIVDDYKKDPLVNRKVSAGMTQQLVFGALFDAVNADAFTTPTLVTYGTKDGVVPSFFSVNWFNAISSQDKRMIGFEGQMHEVLNDPAKDEAGQIMIDWINQHNA